MWIIVFDYLDYNYTILKSVPSVRNTVSYLAVVGGLFLALLSNRIGYR